MDDFDAGAVGQDALVPLGAQGSIADVLDEAGVQLLPNTAGCFTARDAIATAHLAREAVDTDWV